MYLLVNCCEMLSSDWILGRDFLKCHSLQEKDEKQLVREDIATRLKKLVHTNQQRQMETFNVTKVLNLKGSLEIFIPSLYI